MIAMPRKTEIPTLQKKLEEMPELDFTRRVVIPILRALGFKSDDFGGPFEKGKDIVFWKTDDFGEPECGVAQVKKLQPTVSTRTSVSFSDALDQVISQTGPWGACISDGRSFSIVTKRP